MGRVDRSNHSYIESWLSVDKTAFMGDQVKVKKGRTSFIGWGSYINGKVTMGEGVLIGPNVTITSSSHGISKNAWIKDQKTFHKPINIGSDVFIGAGAVVLGGTTIEDHAVIGAGSVVTEDSYIKEYEIWVGLPAKKLKERV